MEIGCRRSSAQAIEAHIVFLVVVDSNLWKYAILGENCERKLYKGAPLGYPINIRLKKKNIKIGSNDLSSCI